MPGTGRRVCRKHGGLRFAARAVGALISMGILATGLASISPPASVADAFSLKPTVGVLDFDAPPTVNTAGTVIPQRFAADDLSSRLAAAAEGRFVMLARDDVRHAQVALNWRGADGTSRDRLSALAERLHANKLVVGRITTYHLDHEGGPGGGARSFSGTANITVRVFDVHTRQWIWHTTASGSGRANSTAQAARNVLRSAVMRTVDGLTTVLSNGK